MRILLIGLPAAGRLQSVRDALGAADVEFEAADSIAEFRSAGETPPELVLVFQDWPEQYTAGEADWLLATHVTTRILCAYGGCCESDGRTRRIWPHAVRVPQWRLEPRLRREIEVIFGRGEPLPLTASRRERFLFEHATQQETRPAPPRSVRIVTPDRVLAGSLAAFLGESLQVDGAAEVVLLDVDPWNARTRTQLVELAEEHPRARIIALAGYPDHVPRAEILAAGAAALLPKLLSIDMLAEVDDPSCRIGSSLT